MGDVLRPIHWSRPLMPKTAGSASLPRRAKASVNTKKCSAGIIPLVFQLYGAGDVTPASSAAALMPPTAVSTSSTEVTRSVASSIPPYSSQDVNLSSFHASAVENSRFVGFKLSMPETLKSIGRRLAETRQALDLTAAEVCRLISCKPNRWSQYENGERKITLEIANKLCDQFGLTLDWIYRANPANLPHNLALKLRKVA